MACPCRILLAAVSAAVALMLLGWNSGFFSRKSLQDQESDGKVQEHQQQLQLSRHQLGSSQPAWRTALDMFTGKFLWDVAHGRWSVQAKVS